VGWAQRGQFKFATCENYLPRKWGQNSQRDKNGI
jgi:hypothetical protein